MGLKAWVARWLLAASEISAEMNSPNHKDAMNKLMRISMIALEGSRKILEKQED